MGKVSDEDCAKDLGWNVLTGIPGVGSVINGFAAANDLRHVITDDKKEDQQQAMRDLAGDCIGMIPAVGTVTGFGSVMYDVMAWGDDTSGNLQNQLLGGKDKYPGPEGG